MTTLYLGIDIAKATFAAAIWWQGQPTQLGEFSNDARGYQQLATAVSRATPQPGAVHLVAEPTGTYHLGLLNYAHEQGWQVSLPNPTTVRNWAKGQGQRSKHDQIDARTLARYGATVQPATQQPLPEEVLTLALLLSRQEDLEKNRQQEKNRLESFQQRPGSCPFVLADLQLSIQFIEERLQQLEQALKAHLNAYPQLKQQRRHLLQVPGIGEKSVLKLLVYLYRWDAHTGGQGDLKGLTAFAGLDPVTFSSGTSVFKRPAISKMGDATIRATLFMCAMGGVHAKASPLVAFYQRLLGRNKPKMVALVAAGRKILSWAFGVFRSGNPFDPALASPKAR